MLERCAFGSGKGGADGNGGGADKVSNNGAGTVGEDDNFADVGGEQGCYRHRR